MAPKKEVGSKKKDDQRRSKDSDADSSSVEQEAEIPGTDKIAISDRLVTCEICLDVMHNPILVMPCSHKFCAGCIYEWLNQEKYCPKCRWYIKDTTRDTSGKELVEAFLVAHPSRTRNEECKTRLDERELFHLEHKDTTFDIEESDDEYMVRAEESEERFTEARDLEIKARRDIDVARMDRLRREKEERERQKTEADAAAKKRTGRKRTNDRRSGGSPVASRLRERPQPNLPARSSRRQMN